MTRHASLLCAFAAAVAAHGLAAVLAGLILARMPDNPLIDFVPGMASVALTIQSAPEIAPPDATPPEPVPEPPPEPTPEPVLPEPVPEPVEAVSDEPALTEPTPEPPAPPAEAVPAPPIAPVAVEGVDTWEVGTTRFVSQYPLGSRMRGEEGLVVVKAAIDVTGRATNAEVITSSGYPALDRAAVKSVNATTFRLRKNSRPTPGTLTLPIRFRLTDR